MHIIVSAIQLKSIYIGFSLSLHFAHTRAFHLWTSINLPILIVSPTPSPHLSFSVFSFPCLSCFVYVGAFTFAFASGSPSASTEPAA